MNTKLFEKIGLTGSEIKVYLALLELGSSKKGPLVKQAGINPSKIYDIMNKLIEKGLASSIIKNKVTYFKAAPPTRIKEYLEEKKQEINSYGKEFDEILPQLELKQKLKEEKADAEIFYGWKGLETAYRDMINTLRKGETDYVFGASQGYEPEKTSRFYSKFQTIAKEKGIKIKAIFNENAREYYQKLKAPKDHVEAKYLKTTTPSEINIYNGKVIIVSLIEKPLVIMIKSEEIAHSFKQWFNIMWQVAER